MMKDLTPASSCVTPASSCDPGLLCHGQEASGAIYVKLGVEPRTAAAGMGMSRIRQLHLEFEG